MALDIVTLQLAKKYTDAEVAGGGAIKGKNCVVSDISSITGGNRVTFQWTLDNGTVQTGTMDVMDGQDGDKGDTGLGVKSVEVSATNHLIVTYDDDTTEDAGEITNITTNIAHISDIDLDNLEDGQILKYNATTQKWENASAGSVDTDLVDLNDVDVDNLSDGQIIVWDATNSKWVNADNTSVTIDENPTSGSANAVSSGGVYTALSGKVDTHQTGGVDDRLMTADEGTKLGGLANVKSIGSGLNLDASTGELTATGASITIDSAMSDSSVNPVQNKVITAALGGKVDIVSGKGLSTEDYTSEEKTKLSGIATGAEVNVQADWNESDSSSDTYILNKPTIGTAGALDVAVSGDASTTQVVKGDDTRLTDSRTPVSHTHTLSDITDAGTAAAKDSTNSVTSGSTALVESGAVKTAIDSAISSTYHPSGDITCAELVSGLLIAANEGNVYNTTDSGTTTADFKEGAGKPIYAGDEVAIVKVGNAFKFNKMAGFIDLSNYIQKSSTSGLVKNDGTIDTSTYATTSQIPDITVKADKVTSAVSGNFAGLDSNGNLTDSGSKASDFLTQHQDITGKADKVSGATNGNIAGLDSSGNLTDSGESVGDIYRAMTFNGVKNLARLQYDDGYSTSMGSITHTYNDGEVTLSAGTASAQSYSLPAISTAGFELEADRAYVLTGVPSNAPEGVSLRLRYNNGSNVTVATDEGEGASFTFTSAMKNASNGYHLMINVGSGTVIPAGGIVIRPMIRYAEDKGTAFEKHTSNNRELDSEKFSYKDNTVLGAKNLFKDSGISVGASITSATVVFTKNADGTFTANGTATGDNAVWNLNNGFTLAYDTPYIVNGGIKQGAYIYINSHKNGVFYKTYAEARGTDVPFILPSSDPIDDVYLVLRVNENTSVTNEVFKPMIRLASDSDDTYAPYAMTNKQITDALAYLEQTVTLSTSGDTTVTFTDARFTTDSVVEIGVSEWGTVPKDVSCTTGVCTVTFGSVDSAHSIVCRVYTR